MRWAWIMILLIRRGGEGAQGNMRERQQQQWGLKLLR